jgi:hypothetical protein
VLDNIELPLTYHQVCLQHKNSPKHWWIFSAQKKNFVWFCVEFHWMANFDHPFLAHLNLLLHSIFLHHSYRCLVSTLKFLLSIKHGILCNPPKTCNFNSYPKLSKLNFQCWGFPFLNQILFFLNWRIWSWSPLQLYWVGFKKFSQNSWPLGIFVKAGTTFVLGLSWSNVN